MSTKVTRIDTKAQKVEQTKLVVTGSNVKRGRWLSDSNADTLQLYSWCRLLVSDYKASTTKSNATGAVMFSHKTPVKIADQSAAKVAGMYVSGYVFEVAPDDFIPCHKSQATHCLMANGMAWYVPFGVDSALDYKHKRPIPNNNLAQLRELLIKSPTKAVKVTAEAPEPATAEAPEPATAEAVDDGDSVIDEITDDDITKLITSFEMIADRGARAEAD